MDMSFIETMARKYNWWKPTNEAAQHPERVLAQVMNMGDFDDMQHLVTLVNDAVLRDVLAHAEPGQFNERSWIYWHYRVGLAKRGCVPPLPQRTFA